MNRYVLAVALGFSALALAQTYRTRDTDDVSARQVLVIQLPDAGAAIQATCVVQHDDTGETFERMTGPINPPNAAHRRLMLDVLDAGARACRRVLRLDGGL